MLDQILPADIFAFMMVFARIGTALMIMPAIGEVYVYPRARLTIALGISLIVTPLISPLLPGLPASPIALTLAIAGEMAIGGFIGFVGRVMVSALSVAGMVIAYQSSLANAFVFNPVSAEQGALAGAFLTVTGLLLIFVTNLHHLLIGGLVESYQLFAPGALPPAGDLSDAIARVVAQSFLLAMQISAPFVVVGLMFTVGVGLLNRLMPQVQMFFVAMPMQIALGSFMLMVTLSAIMLWFLDRFEGIWRGLFLAG